MTEKGLTRRVEFWRKRLCPEWRVAIMPRPPEGQVNQGEEEPHEHWIACSEGDLTISEIRLYFKPEVLEDGEYEIDRTIVHELLHPLFNRVLDHDHSLRPFVGAVAWEIYRDRRHDDEEEFVNRLAHAIVDTYHRRDSYGSKRTEG